MESRIICTYSTFKRHYIAWDSLRTSTDNILLVQGEEENKSYIILFYELQLMISRKMICKKKKKKKTGQIG
jgi:hypothetical protein